MEVDDEIYGVDYSSKGGVTATGDMELVEGLDNAKQSIRNQILTERGTYPSIDDEYGSDIYEVLGEDFEESSIEALSVYIENVLLENPRVLEINNIIPLITVDKKINVMIEVELVNGTEDTLNIEFGGIEEYG